MFVCMFKNDFDLIIQALEIFCCQKLNKIVINLSRQVLNLIITQYKHFKNIF